MDLTTFDPVSVLAVLDRIEGLSPAAYLVAFAAGTVSFLSPCVLPIVPAYLSVVTGLDTATLRAGDRAHARSITITTSLFVLGFGTVFVLLGLGATAIGATLRDHQVLLTRVSGALLLSMALFLAGSLFLQAPWLYQERRFHPRLGRFGRGAPVVAGAAFGFGWTPCIGPVLGSIFGIALTADRVWAGGTLLGVYALGLGLPFLVAGLALGRLERATTWVRRYTPALVGASAAVIGGFGLVLVANRMPELTATLSGWLEAVGLDWMVTLG